MAKNQSNDIQEKIKDFSGLLDQIDGVSDKKKKLWREIYENAVTDRQNAYILFNTLLCKCFIVESRKRDGMI